MLPMTPSISHSCLLIQVLVVIFGVTEAVRFGGHRKHQRGTNIQLPVICKDGWTPAIAENLDGGPSRHICTRVNSQSLTWDQSRDACRANQAYLLKLDKRVKIGGQSLEQHVKQDGISSLWTGLHEEESKLIWDEERPSLVQAYVGPHAGYGKIKRGWRWNPDSFYQVDNTCGVITINTTHPRRRRSVKDFDDLFQSSQGDLDLPDSAPEFPIPGQQHFLDHSPKNLGFAQPASLENLGRHVPSITPASRFHINRPFTPGPLVTPGVQSIFSVTEPPDSSQQSADSPDQDIPSNEQLVDGVGVFKRTTFRVQTITQNPLKLTTQSTQLDFVTDSSLNSGEVLDSEESHDEPEEEEDDPDSSAIDTTGSFLPSTVVADTVTTSTTTDSTTLTVTTELPLTSATEFPLASATELPLASATELPLTSATELPLTSATELPLASATEISLTSATEIPWTSAVPIAEETTPSDSSEIFVEQTTPGFETTTSTTEERTIMETSAVTATETIKAETSAFFTRQTTDETTQGNTFEPLIESKSTQLTVAERSTNEAATSTIETATSGVVTPTTEPSTTSTSATTTIERMRNVKVTHKEQTIVTPSTLGTSKMTEAPSDTQRESTTTVSSSEESSEERTTFEPQTPTTATVRPVVDNAVKENRPRTALTSSATVQFMNLVNCNSFYQSVCYADPIEKLQTVSFCGSGWVGHPNVDKCYKVLPFPETFFLSKNRCLREGGTLATVDSEYYGNLTVMVYSQFRNINRAAPPRAWVDTLDNQFSPRTGCPVLDHKSIRTFNCQNRMLAVCEKPAFIRSFDNPISAELLNRKQVLRMSSTRRRPILCPITTATPEEKILWFKDGVLIQNTLNVRAHPQISDAVMHRRARTLNLDMSLLRHLGVRTGRNVAHESLLQGNYWCEVWNLSPFKRVKSPKFLVVFTDVLNLHGTIQTKGIPHNTSFIFNYMDVPVDVPLVMAADLDIINSNITRSMRTADPVLRGIASYVDHVNSDTGTVEFIVQLSLLRDVNEDYKSRIVSLYLKTLHAFLMPLSREISRHWNLSLPLTDAITILRTDFCQQSYLIDDITGFGATFPKTPIGGAVTSIEMCDGVTIGSATCEGNYETAARWEEWQIITDCNKIAESAFPVPNHGAIRQSTQNNSHVGFENVQLPGLPPFELSPSKALVQLDEIEVEDGNVVDVMEKMAKILEKTSDLTEGDIYTSADVIDRIVKVTKPGHSIGHQLINTVNKILDANVTAITEAQRKTRAATRILGSLETFSMSTDIGDKKTMRLVTPNVALEVWDLDADMAPVIGLGAKVGSSWSYPLTDPRILTIRDRSNSMLADFDVAIELPQSLVAQTIKGEKNTTRLSMLIYRRTGLFTPVYSSDLGLVNSAVISATLGDRKISGLKEMVRMAFRPFKNVPEHVTRTRCGFWNFSLNHEMGGWSDGGCFYNGSMYGRDICLCDHLTNFAVLLDFYGHSKPIAPAHELTLSIISLIGLSLSIFGLALTIITFVFFKKLRQGRAQQTLFQMAVALLCSKVVFLVGIKQTSNDFFCMSVAVLLHYFILVSFLWMLIEAILQYLTFVKILGTYVSRYAIKTILPAWGLPLIPVISVLSIDYNMYRGRKDYCWMGMEAFYYAFALPVGIIIVFNIVMFVIVLVNLVRRPDGLRSTQSKQKRAQMHLKAAVTIFVLLGLTWIFGFLQIEDARVVFQYVFTFLSSLQGFFIFILLVARRRQVREQWMVLCCNKPEKQRAPKQVSPTNSNSTSSNTSSGSMSLHNSCTRTLTANISIDSFDNSYYMQQRRPPPPYKAF